MRAFFAHHEGMTLVALGNAGPVGWTVDSSTLPPGLTLDPFGLLSGTPTAAGFYSINFSLTDGTDTVFRSVSVNVFDLAIVSTPDITSDDATVHTGRRAGHCRGLIRGEEDAQPDDGGDDGPGDAQRRQFGGAEVPDDGGVGKQEQGFGDEGEERRYGQVQDLPVIADGRHGPDSDGSALACGFSSTSEGNDLSYAQQVAKLRLIVDVAADVWGD